VPYETWEVMASVSKRARVDFVDPEDELDLILNDENSPNGMSSDEESDLDRQLENETEESR